ncbi:MAG TPA: DNA polymerase III subunit gamma/tau, partial [Candidatus Dormibacteraeota bacterium]|nr:DNA polymerase III subunit gamma/tau [Candidatus Dormibacteraeota bacterium]
MTALYTRYRSQRFDALVGQDAAVRTLKNALSGDRVAHAYLFTGIRGTGKTSTARILAKAVNCLGLVDGEPDNTCVSCVAINDATATDLIEIDAASNRGIDEIRDLREKANYMPALLKRKVYIIDEAHQLTDPAFNALLKTLEEPPEHVLFILCTTESHKLPATIISRTQRFDFRRISEAEIAGRLAWISEQERLQARPDGLALLAAMAQGSMRDAITMLDQMASSGVDAIDASTVRRQLGLVTQRELAGMLAAAARGDAATVLRELDGMATQGADMRQLTSNLAEVARKAVLLAIGAGDAAALGIDEAAAPVMAELVAGGGREF